MSRRFMTPWLVLFFAAILSACGGGGSSAPAPQAPPVATSDGSGSVAAATPPGPQAANSVAVVLDSGFDGTAFNSPFVSVTVCVPGTQTCTVVDHVLVDTGSYGLRLAASAIGGNLALPAVKAPSGQPMGECAPFASGFAWGSVRAADVQMSGEKASAIPVQVVNDPAAPYANVPAACSNSGANFGVGTGSKGILGVGPQARDCGPACAASAAPAIYFSCPASGCVSTTAPLASQVPNPVAAFAQDNNGVVIALPAVPATGSNSPTGRLTFGIGTQANNAVAGATVYATDPQGDFTTTYKGERFSSFLDSGSNALFFPDAAIPQCPSSFYCPPAPLALSATITSATGVSAEIPFTVVSPQNLAASTTAAPVAGNATGLGRVFDWGLPFFLGRTVFVAFTGALTPAGAGPYIAF